MATVDKLILSGSTQGRPLVITATTTGAAQILHASTASTTVLDEVYIWACNIHATTVGDLTLEFGTATTHVEYFGMSVSEGWFNVCPGLILSNSDDVQVFASATTVFHVAGYVLRKTP